MKSRLGLAKEVIWNRRYTAWRTWFFALFLIAIACIWRGSLEIFKVYATWSSIGLVALIGGLSATDFIAIKKEK